MTKNIFGLLKEVLSDKKLTAFDKNVFACLITFNGKGKIFPSREEIMKRLNSSNLPTISKSTHILEDRGYIKIIRRKHTSNIYKLVLNKAETKMNLTKGVLNESVRSITLAKLNECSIDESCLNTILKINSGADEVYKKCLMLLYCIGLLEKRKEEINNYQSYLITTYKNLTYSKYHKEVFESTVINKKIRNKTVSFKTGKEYSYI